MKKIWDIFDDEKEEKVGWSQRMRGIGTVPEIKPKSPVWDVFAKADIGIGAKAVGGATLEKPPIIEGLPISKPEDKPKTLFQDPKMIELQKINLESMQLWFKGLKESKDKWAFLKGEDQPPELKELRRQYNELAPYMYEKSEEWIQTTTLAAYAVGLAGELIPIVAKATPEMIRSILNKVGMKDVGKEELRTALYNVAKGTDTTAQRKIFDEFIKAKELGVPFAERLKGVKIPTVTPRFAFGTKLYAGLPADEIVKSIIKVGKVSAEMVKGLDPAKVAQVAQQLINTSPALASEFLKAVTKEEELKVEPKPPTKEEVYAEKYGIPLEKVKITELKKEEAEERKELTEEQKKIQRLREAKIVPKEKPEPKRVVKPEVSEVIPKAIPKELEPLAEEARKYGSAEEFVDKVSQDNLMDLSDPTKHKWGRAIPQTIDEAVDTVASIEKNPKGYLEDIRLSTPDTYNAIMRGDKNVTIYRAVPPTKEQMITFFEGELSKVMQYGGRKTYPFAEQLGFSPSKIMSDYYNYLSEELPKIKSGESRFIGVLENKLGIGDYVALDKNYVKMHGESVLIGQQKYPTYKIVSKTVPKTDVIWGQADFNEWVYSPQNIRDKAGNLTDFYTQATATTEKIAEVPKVEPKEVSKFLTAEEKYPERFAKGEAKEFEKFITEEEEEFLKAEKEYPAKIVKEEVEELQPLATPAQIKKAHVVANTKALISEKGKMRPQYREIAKTFTDQKSIKKMTKEEAETFIDMLERLPEPKIKEGKLVPPSIPRTMKLTTEGFFQKKYGEPTPIWLLTDQTYYATKLGIKPLVEPFEKGKIEFDLEFRKSSNLVDRMVNKLNTISKTPMGARIRSKVKNVPTKAESNMAELVNKHEATPSGLSEKESDVFKYFRNLGKDIWRRENEVREIVGLPPIKYKTAYFRHTADAMAKEMLEGKYPFPQGIKYWSEKVVGKKIFNPMEFQRKLSDDLIDLWSKDIRAVTKAMLWSGLKEIYLAEPAKFLNEQLNAISKDLPEYKNLTPREQAAYDQTRVMPASTKKHLVNYVNQVLKGQETELDASLNRIVTKSGLKGIFDKVLSPFGRAVGRKPITNTFALGGRVIISSVMGWVPRQIQRNAFQPVQNLALYGVKATIKAFLPASVDKNLVELMSESLFRKSYTGYEELPTNIMAKLEKIWLGPYGIVAVNNAKLGMKAAYWNIIELIRNPKFKKHGWADPQRTKDTPKGFLYPSEKEKLLKEMEFGASATQYQYIPMGMPGVFRYKALIPLTRLQSWWMNYFTKFLREALHRAFKGRPSWSGEDGPTLPWSRRVNFFKYLIIGGAILTSLGYKRSFLIGVLPAYISPAGQVALGMYNYATADEDWKRERALRQIYYSWKAFIPGSLAWRDFLAVWKGEKDLEEILFYGKKEEKKAAPKSDIWKDIEGEKTKETKSDIWETFD